MGAVVIVVDGETFEITERGGGWDYRWIDGRHHGDYGFVSTPNVRGVVMSMEEHRAAIRSFLDAVDPTTGYLE